MSGPRLAAALVVSLIACPPSIARAQQAPDPSGHWEGAIDAPKGTLGFEIDLGKDAAGVFVATFSQPSEHIRGLPLSGVTVEGPAVRFVLNAGSGGGAFEGVVSADGRSMSGHFNANTKQGIFPVAFSATRKGEAHVDAPPRNAPVGREIEGVWSGAIDVGGKSMRLLLKMENRPDGTCAASLVSVDEGGMKMPVGVGTEGGGAERGRPDDGRHLFRDAERGRHGAVRHVGTRAGVAAAHLATGEVSRRRRVTKSRRRGTFVSS